MRKELVQARNSCRMTQEQVAQAIGISVRNYQNIEAGTTKPNVETAISIAELLNGNVRDLFQPQRQLREDDGEDDDITSRKHGVNVEAIPKLCRFMSEPHRVVTAALDLQDGSPDTPEGAELVGLIRNLAE
ncbi:helix-turn-helix transcriptional regulator [Aminithiophilus ramosus]|uniref:Helix-turn-helix transcriptional regulator n=1 Tax=Aminithiophilus ramosus TaxID=3029084 RepID=A0A9Q7AAL5_9BACT|nr:helix-turn-helix transcriptional regulator [Aminithiophilus ramosus]QTX33241.1 helix-turn-helix transcriptional regulator [Aminithiophilus ramosus]